VYNKFCNLPNNEERREKGALKQQLTAVGLINTIEHALQQATTLAAGAQTDEQKTCKPKVPMLRATRR